MSVAQAARQLGWDEQALRRLNDIPPRMKLKAGATILVPREGRLDRDVPEHIADNGQILLAPEPPPVKTVKVRVRAGETLASVARRYRVPVADLAAWNQLRVTDKLRPGQILCIQVASKARGAQPPTRSAKATPKPRAPATKLAQRR
jgi:membrane-bound lytic murein transglycosylase D